MEQNNIGQTIQDVYQTVRMHFPPGEIMDVCLCNIDRYNSQIAVMIKRDQIDVKELKDIEFKILQDKELFQMAHLDYVTGYCPDKSLMN